MRQSTQLHLDDGQNTVPSVGRHYGAALAVFAALANAALAHAPRVLQVVMFPIPRESTMEEPCAGVPANAWCTAD